MMRLKLLIMAVAISLVCFGSADAKGGRGGSRGGSRGGYYGGGYRSTGSGGYRISNFRSWSTSQKTTAALLGSIYISRTFRTRYGAGLNWDEDPTVCRNVVKFAAYNGSQTTMFGYFLCPTDNATSEMTYCCGSEGYEYCCDFWASEGVKVIVGCSIAGVVIVIGIAVLIFFILKHKKPNRPAPSSFTSPVFYSNSAANIGVNSEKRASYDPPVSTPYPVQPAPTTDPALPPQYDSQFSAPYPPTEPSVYPSSPPPPYPSAFDAKPQ